MRNNADPDTTLLSLLPVLKVKLKSRYPQLHRRFKYLRAWVRDINSQRRNAPPALIPKALLQDFTMQGRVPVLYAYSDNSRSEPLSYNSSRIDANIELIKAGKAGHYGDVDEWLYEALHKFPIRGMQVAIMGSAEQGYGPWYESICLAFGGSPTTIDYNAIEFGDERVRFIQAPLTSEQVAPFDAAFSISSFEHDGLGRYGDPCDPDADLRAMHAMKQLLKPGGLLYLTVPVGQDKVVYNVHRIYGRLRLPLLLEGWTVVDSFGFEDKLLDRDTGYGWMPRELIQTSRGTEERLIHPGCPSFEPVWVLRND